MMAVVSVAAFTACDDDNDTDYVYGQSAIKIVSQDLSFPAAASTRTVTVDAPGAVTVTSSDRTGWVTTSVEGNVITVSVTENSALDGRAAMLTIACGDDKTTLSLVQSGLIFDFQFDPAIETEAEATVLTYAINANAPVTVTSDVDWIRPAIADGVLSIDIKANPLLTDRAGKLTLTCANSSTELLFTQKGLVFPLFKVEEISGNDDAAVYTYEFKADIEVKFATDDSWIHASFADNVVTVTIDENATGHMRNGILNFEVAGETGSVAIEQWEFDKDIAGDYYLFFTNPSTGADSYFNATFKKTDSTYAIDLPDLGLSIPVTWDANTLSLTAAAGGYLGIYSPYYTFLTYGFTNPSTGKTSVTWSDTAAMSAAFEYFEEEGVGYTVADFIDTKTYTYELTMMMIYAFNEATASSSSAAGSLARLQDPELLRMTPLETEAPGETQEAVAKKAFSRKGSAKPMVISAPMK